MEFGISNLSVISIRQKPTHESEQISQLLFGEIFTIIERSENWIRVITDFDNYQGWVQDSQIKKVTELEYKNFQKLKKSISAELVQTISGNEKSFPILIGSNLYEFDGMNFKFGKENFIYSGQAISTNIESFNNELFKKIALKFLHSPYQWGGRSPFGIDCSGFTQIVFKVCGINLPRDAYQQAEIGKTIHFIPEAKECDLIFFDNEDGKITHVGIYLGNQEIIHASGKVRIDYCDHYGIFQKDMKKYSHKLRMIKRIV